MDGVGIRLLTIYLVGSERSSTMQNFPEPTKKQESKVRANKSNNKSKSPVRKSLFAVEETTFLLQSLLGEDVSYLPFLYKVSWRYDRQTLLTLAARAKKQDSMNTPYRLFIYYVKEFLDYQPGQK